jgi:hypothetical protein
VTPETLRKELALLEAVVLTAKSGRVTASATDQPDDVIQLLLGASEPCLGL